VGITKTAGKLAAPIARRQTPDIAASLVRDALDHALDGVGPLRGAVPAAERQLKKQNGDVSAAIRAIVDSHVQLAGMAGFATNLGGVITSAVTIPANLAGLALLQCHMVAAIAHLRGYDVHDPRVRNAIIACMLGAQTVKSLVKKKVLPSGPMAIATAPVHDPKLDNKIAAAVTSEMITRATGKRAVGVIARRTPIIGGGMGAVTDGLATYDVGKYAARELKPRPVSP
jgi:EcsC protein family